MKHDADLDMKLLKAKLYWPDNKPGLEEELQRIAKDHEESKIAWKHLGPVIWILVALAIWLALSASGQL